MKDLVFKDFTCGYEEKCVFEHFDLKLDGGKINVILGGSGVGKTTLLNAIAGLKSYGGSIDGNDEGISYIFQKDRLIPTISVFKNLDLALRGVYKDKNERKKRIEEMAAALEIQDILKSLPTNISGGQAQRASMARAFLYPSKVMLLDEPFKALDTALKTRLIRNFVRLCEGADKTVVFVTHAIDECLLCADKYFVFRSNPVELACEGEILLSKSSRSLTDRELDATRNILLEQLLK